MPVRRVGRYLLYEAFASGGMASVHVGRMLGPAGFSRTVAIKRLHAHLAQDPEFVSMFLDEARLAARIQHPNAVATLDVVASEGELFLVMDYVLGESWSQLVRAATAKGAQIPLRLVSGVLGGMLNGLHAAHEARTERGEPMNLVHRDVSPQNVLVGADGTARIVDFGVAKAVSRVQSTQGDKIKGKIAYMAPEQLLRRPVDRRADVYAAGIVLWEALTGSRLFTADDPGAVVAAVLEARIPAPSSRRPEIPAALDAIVLCATAAQPGSRYSTALELLEALEAVVPPPPSREIASWVVSVAGPKLDQRRKLITAIEEISVGDGARASREDAQVAAVPSTREEARRMAEAPTSTWASSQVPTRTEIRVPTATPTTEPASAIFGVTPPASSPRPTSKTRWTAVAIVPIAALGGVLWFRTHSTSSSSSSTHPLALVAPEPQAVAAEVTVPDGAPAKDPTSAPRPSADLSAMSLGEPQPDASAPPSHAGSFRPRVRARGPTTSGPEGCNPNFTVDANGVKRFKPWCF